MSRRPEVEQPQSTALLANLEETRREVVIPAEYRPLLDSVEPFFGVHKVAQRMLIELHHPLRSILEVENCLGQLCGGMYHYLERSESRAEIVALINGIFGDLYSEDLDPAVLTQLVGTHLQLLDTLSRSRFADSYGPIVAVGLDDLRRLQDRDGTVILRHGGLVRRLAEKAVPHDGLRDGLAELYGGVVDLGLTVFEDSVDLERWSWSEPVGTAAEVLIVVAGPLTESIRVARLDRVAAEEAEGLLVLPSLDDLLDMVMMRARELPSPIERIALYVHLAGVDELQHRNMEILRALHIAIRTVCSEGDDQAIMRAVDLITGHLSVCRPSHKPLLYKCLEKLGQGIAPREDPLLIQHFVDRTMASGFEGPEVSGVLDDWQTSVNPHHLPCLRTWLAIIESDPVAFEQLLSALIINLHVEGVFVSDTDLFQRDVSRLLNSDIADAFNLIMQLLAYFPVFFNEVGSEGELREVSTRIDQITHRRDPIIHFLRKQSHAESNNRLVGFSAAVFTAWRTGEFSTLQPYLPLTVFEGLSVDADWFSGIHRVVAELAARGFADSDLETIDPTLLEDRLGEISVGSGDDRERVALLVRMYQLLRAKYSYSPEHVLASLELSPLVEVETREAFAEACVVGEHLGIVTTGNRVLEELKATIVDHEVTEAFETIFHKRHIAAGIPSMYGTYREPKFDSMGLLLRMMTYLKPHLEACVASFNFNRITPGSIQLAVRLMKQMLAGLVVSGLRVRHLATQLDLLERGIGLGTLSAHQYLNILDLMSEALNDAVATNYISLHGANLEKLAGRKTATSSESAEVLAADTESRSERFLRDLIASTYAIQEFDVFLRRARNALRELGDERPESVAVPTPEVLSDRLISFLGDRHLDHEDQLRLGFKGDSLKRLKTLGLPVPDGFVVSSEVFALQPDLRTVDLDADICRRILSATDCLEEVTGRRLGNPKAPLLLSARSGAAFSMPGMMDTILNVGLNQELLESLNGTSEAQWGAWDCYRRYLQGVAMSCGVNRNRFDDLMSRHKARHGVERKSQFTPRQMRDVAMSYRDMVADEGVEIHDDPRRQLEQAVLLVLRSWFSEPATVYRRQMQLADEWGTAVLVQEMVLGNMNASSGSGVVFTRNPRSASTGIGLYGDFTLCSQGEDVVAGLVHPLPVSEAQRREYSAHLEFSLQSRFPEIYKTLKTLASNLINDHNFEHQEIEFTFESSSPEDLHILQIRPMRMLRQAGVAVFEEPETLEDREIAAGIGVSGGALNGRVAFGVADVENCRARYPDDGVILLRPDTVPEDIGLVLAVDGVLTARGGFTSHAAVTAKRLGKCCIVNCSNLVVDDTTNVARIDNHSLLAGDSIAIDGVSGRVYLGEHAVATARGVHRLS